LEILKRIEKRGAVTVALNIRGWFSQIFRFAVSTLRADSDPAAALRGAIKRGKVQHSKPLSKSELAKLEGKIDECGGNQQTKIALRLLMHTFLRTGELRQAKWSEVDLEGRTWTIPAERMKMREKHIVPLSR
jgi:integrase